MTIPQARLTFARMGVHVYRRAANRDTRRHSFMTPTQRASAKKAAAAESALLAELGASLSTLRLSVSMGQRAVAAQTGYSFKQISNIERAQNWPSPALYERICAVFGVDGRK